MATKRVAFKRPLDKIIISGLADFLVSECVLFNGDLKVLLEQLGPPGSQSFYCSIKRSEIEQI